MRQYRSDIRPAVIDLFAGAGGLSLGAARAGFDLCGAVDLDSRAMSTHQINFPNVPHICCDLNQITGSELLKQLNRTQEDIAGLIGGPPCQGFSTMGHRNPDDMRNNLFIRFFQLVKEIKPTFFLAENVPGILNKKFQTIREAALKEVADDYSLLSPMIINAKELGAPTARKRVFFIGVRKGLPIDLYEDDFQKISITSKVVKVGEALKGLPIKLDSVSETGEAIIDHDFSVDEKTYEGQFYLSRVVGIVPDGIGDLKTIDKYYHSRCVTGMNPTRHTEAVIKRFSNVPAGKSDQVSKCVRLDLNSYCPTLRAGTGPDRGSYQAIRPIHYSEPRVITPREAARLQGFPDWFVFQPSIWHSFRQIGNSVSPIVAEKILSIIFQKFTR